MKVRCIAKTGADIPESYLKRELGNTKETEFTVTLGKEYLVYALYEWQGNIWYYICDDNYIYYPRQNPAPLFEVVDPRLSKYWRFRLSNGVLKIAFEQWFADPYFYDKLTDAEEAEVLIFEKVKEFMDAEALSMKSLPVERDRTPPSEATAEPLPLVSALARQF